MTQTNNRISPKGWAIVGAIAGGFIGYILPVPSPGLKISLIVTIGVAGSVFANEVEYQWLKRKDFSSVHENQTPENDSEIGETTSGGNHDPTTERMKTAADQEQDRFGESESNIDEVAERILHQIDEEFNDFDHFIDCVSKLYDEEQRSFLDQETEYPEIESRPDMLVGVTQRINTGYGHVYVNINEDNKTGHPVELFASIGNSGGFTASYTEALAKTITLCFQAGVDPDKIAEELRGIRSPKVAWDKGEQIQSIPDAIGVAIHRYMDREETPIQSGSRSPTGKEKKKPDIESTEVDSESNQLTSVADGGTDHNHNDSSNELISAGEPPECPDCGSMSLFYSEGVKQCEACGWTEASSSRDINKE